MVLVSTPLAAVLLGLALLALLLPFVLGRLKRAAEGEPQAATP